MRAWLLTVVLLAVLHCPVVQARSSVWQVTGPESHLYIAGSIQTLAADDYPLPCEFEFAFGASDSVLFEVDLRVLEDASFQRRYRSNYYFGDGSTLHDKLTPANRMQLDGLLADAGLGREPYARMKPAVLASLLIRRELNRVVGESRSPERYFIDLASKHARPVRFLTRPVEYLDEALRLTDGNENEYMLELLDSLQQFGQMAKASLTPWREGDLDALARILEVPRLIEQGPVFLRTSLIQQNLAWLRKLEALLATASKEMAVISAANLVTDSGVLSLLELRGYQVEPVNECRS